MSGALNHTALLQLLQLVASAGAAAARQKSASEATRANAVARAHEAELAAKVRALEIAAQREHSQQQTAILSKVIDAYKHIEDRKFDLVLEAFRATHGLLAEQQRSLLEKRREIRQQISEVDTTKEVKKFLFLRKSITEIGNELEDIRRSSQMLQMQVQMFTQAVGVSFRLPALPAV